MDNIYAIRGKLGQFYAEYSKFIDKGIQFVLALITFLVINSSVGFMKLAASPLVSVALALVAMFLPLNFTILIAAILLLAHTYALSLGAVITTALIFVILYIFFFLFFLIELLFFLFQLFPRLLLLFVFFHLNLRYDFFLFLLTVI